jgi:hypothetical protein
MEFIKDKNECVLKTLLTNPKTNVPTPSQIENFVSEKISMIENEVPMGLPIINFYEGMKLHILNLLIKNNTPDKKDKNAIDAIICQYYKMTNLKPGTGAILDFLLNELFDEFYTNTW